MKIKTAVGAALLAATLTTAPAFAAGTVGQLPVARASQDMMMPRLAVRSASVAPAVIASRTTPQQADPNGLFAVAYGDTLPPVGFVNFCVNNKPDCQDYSWSEKLAPQRIELSAERWKLVYQINTLVNNKIKPVSDQARFGKPEVWAYPTTQGDCEDYALLKKRMLQQLGLPAKLLQMTVVLDEHNEGHAVLTLASSDGDYVLDNRRNDVLLWNDTNYTFLKRQSVWNPRQWISLQNKSAPTAIVASAQR